MGARRFVAALLPLAATLVGAAVLGCGDGGGASGTPASASPGAGSAARPVLCARLHSRITGTVSAPAATELSGLAISHSQRGILWTHNDSGDQPRVFAITSNGNLLSDLDVPNAENFDWEDIEVGPGTRHRDALYLADIGDNTAQRADVVVYKVPEPRRAGRGQSSTAPAQRLVLRYPDGAHDAEALLVSPTSGTLVIVTKDFSGKAGVYVAARPRSGATATLRRTGGLALGGGEAVTAGDVSADGRTIALRSYFRAFAWSRRSGESITKALRRKPCSVDADLLDEGQGEALALTRDGRAFYTVPEGQQPPVRRYSPSR